MPVPLAELKYYREHKTEMEESLAEAVYTTIAEQHNDPVSRVAELLKRQRRNPAKSTQNHQWAAQNALDRYKPAPEASDGQTWQAKKWLDSLPLTKIVADTLLRPLREKHRPYDSGPELAFVQAIGEFEDWMLLHDILASKDVLEGIAKTMWKSAKELRAPTGGKDSKDSKDSVRSKFVAGPYDFEDSTGEQLSLGRTRSRRLQRKTRARH